MSNAIKPEHYNRLNPQPKDVIRAWGLNFNLGSAVKYISRAGLTGRIADIKDAVIYVDAGTLFHSNIVAITLDTVLYVAKAEHEHIEDMRRA